MAQKKGGECFHYIRRDKGTTIWGSEVSSSESLGEYVLGKKFNSSSLGMTISQKPSLISNLANRNCVKPTRVVVKAWMMRGKTLRTLDMDVIGAAALVVPSLTDG